MADGQLDLTAIEVLGVAECDLDVSALGPRDWPCPSCGNQRSLGRAWAMKVRNRTGPPLERGVVVCERCFGELGEHLAREITGEPITLQDGDDPVELLSRALDTDEVEVPFRL